MPVAVTEMVQHLLVAAHGPYTCTKRPYLLSGVKREGGTVGIGDRLMLSGL